MTNNKILNNDVTLIGAIIDAPKMDHSVYGVDYYRGKMVVKRNSGILDEIPFIVSDKTVNISKLNVGSMIAVDGVYRSYNCKNENGKSTLDLYVLIKNVCFDMNIVNMGINNRIYLNGYICKDPVFRKTPKGRKITDVLLAVNGSYGRSEYVPCIIWGNNAKKSKKYKVGTNIEIWGRIQSRDYTKRIDDKVETRTAYEISVDTVNVVA